MSFLEQEAIIRLKGNAIIGIYGAINWSRFSKIIGRLGRSNYGPSGYDLEKMLKALILQSWYSLSDCELEEALSVRLDFMVATGLIEVPDSTTICRFRKALIEKDLMKKLLKELNRQLEEMGLKVKESRGAILDATIIESCSRPNKTFETVAVDREEDEATYEVTHIRTSHDPDATWLKKGKRYFYGYKGFVTTDAEDGYIEEVHVTPANVSEMREFKKAIENTVCTKRRLYADKGSASKNNREVLKSLGFKDGIMHKASKNKPLSKWQKRFNKLISKTRFKVEQCFGTIKRRFKFTRASYKTTEKVHGQMILKSIAFNLLKAINLSIA
jgi:IS5 family transposase